MSSFSITGLIALSVCAFAADTVESGAAARTVVEVDGAKFTAADVQRKGSAALFQARNALYDAERKAADELVNEYLLERQAKKESLSVTELIKKHVEDSVEKAPPEEALRVFYDGVDTTEPYEAVRDKIIDAIRQRRIAKARTAYINTLRKQANISISLPAPRIEIALDKTPIRGAADAPVKLVEYSDYECPYCQQIQPAIARLEAEFKGKIAFAYKDVPLPMHARAQKAAEASHCAGAQGKYWEYHDLLFETKQLEISQLKEHARTLQLDGTAFDKCLAAGETAPLVQAQVSEAQSFGLPGTPGIFVNGRFLNGAVDYRMLRAVIEEELRSAAAQDRNTVAGNGHR